MANFTEAKIAEYKEAIEKMREAAPLNISQAESKKNIEDLSLEDITEDLLIEQFLDMGAELGVDTRQGSIYWDASMGSIIRTSMLLEQLSMVNEIISLKTCTGDVLDEKMMERGLARNPEEATPATYYVEFNGEIPELDSVMTCEDYFFTLQERGDKYVIVSDDLGTELNNLVPGTEVIPEIDVDGLISATLGQLVIPAIDIEDDDSARERLISRISGPDENGNQSQIKTWCESVEGVGSARIIPLWDGPNTVMGVIVSKSGGVPTEGVVDAVQKYVDPEANGMGEGAANIGQFFTAMAVEAVVINISVSVLKKNEATYSGIKDDFIEKLKSYFENMALEDYTDGMAIRYVRVGALLEGLENVIDYDDLTLNGMTENVTFSILQIPVLGEVTVDGNI
jgi:uncharacterized phage protein gp47/JayE